MIAMRRSCHRLLAAGFVIAGLTAMSAGSASAAQPPVGLGSATGFAVLAGSTVTNTGSSVIAGDVGLSPGSAIVGFPPGVVQPPGTIRATDAVAALAQLDLTAAYDDAASRIPLTATPADLAGLTLVAGVYGGPTIELSGTVTLDAQGDTGAVFVFQSASTLITAPGSVVSLINGANPCNVYWQVSSSATLDTTSVFRGTVMALASITARTGATIEGRLLARNGAVTLDSNTITAPAGCAVLAPTPTTTTTTTAPATTTTIDSGATTTPATAAPASTDVATTVPAATTPPTLPPITLPVTGAATHGIAGVGTVALVLGMVVLVALPRIPRRRRRPHG